VRRRARLFALRKERRALPLIVIVHYDEMSL
jgi:hypothetical protein